jgi:eukaryotic-like serine/threonine-protein kinase
VSLRKFEILEMIAKGGMAEVYKAKTVGLEGFAKDVCVKKILPHLTQDDQFVTMFINEAKLAATLSYANIVQVHDLCVSADREYFIVMEYVHGKDLSDIIRAAQLAGREIPAEIAIYIAREVCKGLYYAHSKTDPEGAPLHIIHRDISPQNVLVSFMGEVKITDFGIAKASSIMNKTAVGILKGKYGYMSPEQARGEPLDHRSDIFNLGIVLYEMLVGERCFAGASDYSTLNLMREAVVTPPSKINKNVGSELESIVMRCLQKEVKARWKDGLDLEGALASLASKSGKEARSADVARFMKELFAAADPPKTGQSTGVLALSSIVGPPAEPGAKAHHDVHSQPAKAEVPAPEAKPAALMSAEGSKSKAEAPGAAALERAKKRARDASLSKSDKVEEAPKPAPEEAKKPAEEPKPAPAPVEPEKKPEEKPEKPAKAAKAKKAEASEAPAAAPAAPQAAEAPAEKPEKKPARLKPVEGDGEAKKDKKEEKKQAAADKKPIGRKDLRPGLTSLIKLRAPSRGRSAGRIAAIVLVTAAIGAATGLYHGRRASQQATFRMLELDGREAGKLEAGPMIALLIETDPPGAAVWLDKSKLAEKTPLMVDRALDDKTHELELAHEGFKNLKKTIQYAKGPLTIVRENLEGEVGELVVRTRPTNVTVKVDGKDVGTSPLSVDVPQGRRVIELAGDEIEPVRQVVEIVPGQKTTIDRSFSKKGLATTAAILTHPPSRVLIDGIDTGQRADGRAIAIEPGTKHRVTLVDDARGIKKDVFIQQSEGEQKRYVLELGS